VEWSLEPNAEREYLLLWLDSESDAGAKNQVVAWIAGLLQNPLNREHLEDPSILVSIPWSGSRGRRLASFGP
jgi:hypothetical protein